MAGDDQTLNSDTLQTRMTDEQSVTTATSNGAAAAEPARPADAVAPVKATSKKARATSRKTGPSASVEAVTDEQLALRALQEAAARSILCGDAAELQRLIRPGVAQYPQNQWAGQTETTHRRRQSAAPAETLLSICDALYFSH